LIFLSLTTLQGWIPTSLLPLARILA